MFVSRKRLQELVSQVEQLRNDLNDLKESLKKQGL
jgi:hypothetical protein